MIHYQLIWLDVCEYDLTHLITYVIRFCEVSGAFTLIQCISPRHEFITHGEVHKIVIVMSDGKGECSLEL